MLLNYYALHRLLFSCYNVHADFYCVYFFRLSLFNRILFCPVAFMYDPRTVCDALFLSGFLQRNFQRQFAIELWRWKYKEDYYSPSYGCYCLRIWTRDSDMYNGSRWQTASASRTSLCALPEHNDSNETVMFTRLVTPFKRLYVVNKCYFLAREVCVVLLSLLAILFDVDIWSNISQYKLSGGTL